MTGRGEVVTDRGEVVTGQGEVVTAHSGATRVGHRFFVVRELGILLALVLLVAVTALTNPRFLSAQSCLLYTSDAADE